MASLTRPTRPPYINTFKELVDREDITIIGNANSFMEYLDETQDPIMMVFTCSMPLLYAPFVWIDYFRN